jgi:hypothetical protein
MPTTNVTHQILNSDKKTKAVINEESYDLRMEEDPTAQDRSPKVNRG